MSLVLGLGVACGRIKFPSAFNFCISECNEFFVNAFNFGMVFNVRSFHKMIIVVHF